MELVRNLEPPKFEKVAAKFTLGDNPSTHPSELLAHLYKQHPFLGKYVTNLSIEGQDDSMGYMYGVFLVSPPKEIPPSVAGRRFDSVERDADPPPSKEMTLRVPIIVENRKAYSFDVFITPAGKFRPLNEQRVAAALFEASPYSVAPENSSAYMSPGMQAGGSNFSPSEPTSAYGGGSMSPNAVIKQGSALDKLSSAVRPEDVESLFEKISSTRSLRDSLSLNEAFASAMVKLASFASEVDANTTEEIPSFDDYDAVVVSKSPGGYLLKFASADGFSVRTATLTNAQAESLPLDIRQEVISDGNSLLVSPENVPLVGVEKTANLQDAVETGVYSVLTKNGHAERAVVINDVRSLAGGKLDLSLIVGPSGASFQEKVAGVRCGDVDLSSLEGGEPHGEGIFIFKEAGQVSEPVDIKYAVNTPDGRSYHYEHPLRGVGSLKMANVMKPVAVSDVDYLIPETSVFVPLSYGRGYATDPVSIDKIASRQDTMRRVHIRSSGSEFDFSGRPVEKLAKAENLKEAEALLLLGALGDTPVSAREKLAAARGGELVDFVSARLVGGSKEKVAGDAEVIQLAEYIRMDLVKEAAVLAGPDTVDSVLSLNFVTPENVQGYLDALPDLEAAGSKLAELLVGVRLGLSDVPESAVSSALQGIERAIQGLKKLQMRANVAL